MNAMLMNIAAAFAVAFALASLTTVSIRSEEAKGVVFGSFLVSAAVLIPVLLWVQLPLEVVTMIAGVSLMIGLLCVILLKAAKRLEQNEK
jgi:hypothetical protein